MSAQGFTPMDATPRPRLVLAVDALQKRGKTRFALTAPKPLGYINLDRAFETSQQEVQELAADCFIADLSGAAQRIQPGKGKLGEGVLDPFKKSADELHQDIVNKLMAGCQTYRTVVLDTATRWWEVMRVARFGKLTQVNKEHYGPIKAEFERYLFQALGYNCNIILLHRQRSEYQNDVKTGRFERAGYTDVQYIVHGSVELTRVPLEQRVPVGEETEDLGFRATLSDCAHNPRADGVVLRNEEIDFLTVALTLRPDSAAEEWL
jgi:hypothetical protein